MPDTVSRRGREQSLNSSGQPFRHEQPSPSPPPQRHQSLPQTATELARLPDTFWSTVDAGCAELEVSLKPGARAAIDAQVRLLLAWNGAINLTALRTPEQISGGHVLDSLSAVPVCLRVLARSGVEPAAAGLLDLGSGAGYPGLPLALAAGVGRCGLVDSVAKKAAFLRVAAAAAESAVAESGEVGPVFEVLAERAEDLADEATHRAGWDIVIARAVGSLAEVAELSLPLLKVGGHLLAWKGEAGGGLRTELEAARPVMRAAGGSRAHVERADPTGALGLGDHVLVTIRKARPTPDRYPRNPSERRRAALLR